MIKILSAAALASLANSPVAAQDAHAGHASHAGHADHAAKTATTARLNLETPVEAIVADAQGKAVLEANLPGVTTHEHYEAFKSMGLRQLAGMAPAQLPAQVLAKIETELAAIK